MLPVFVCLHVFLGWRQGECRLEYCINAIENKIAIMGGLLETESESIRRGMRVDAHCVPGGIPRRSRHYLQISAPISWTYQDVRQQRVKNCGWTGRVSQLGFACAETTFNWPAIGGCTACANGVLAAVSFESFDFGCFFASDFNL